MIYMQDFANFVSEKTQVDLSTWDKLYSWSITDLSSFWQLCSDYVKIQWIQKPHTTYIAPPPGKMRGARWFEGGTLNFCQNLLPPPDDRIVILSLSENKTPVVITGKKLHKDLANLAHYLKNKGVRKHDVLCAVLTNSYEAILAMLACTSLGAIWSSCSPDFGAEALIDRFQSIKPKLCFYSRSYTYNSKHFDCTETVQKLFKNIPSLEFGIASDELSSILNTNESPDLTFEETSFDHPVYILFSSGTTGVPKCIVHGAGGTLLQHKKEHRLHCNLSKDDTLFFYTTCGWMMWNWMVSALASETRLLLYDASPKLTQTGLWDIVAEHKVTVFGTSPKFLSLSMNESWSPKHTHDLSSLRCILSTGSPILPEHFPWVKDHVKDIPLISISGGTDIISCFMLGNPLLPITPGDIQSPGLGMNIVCMDEHGNTVKQGEKGELVCLQPFVSMPLYFLNDEEGSRYHQSYFSFYEKILTKEVWRHGDYIAIQKNGSITVYGRSDATLNPGGVRIGTAELYRCLDTLPFIEDALALSYEFVKGDPVILLFVKLKALTQWSSTLSESIRTTIRKHLSPRHLPHSIFSVQEIPYTRNGKKIELAAQKALYGLSVPNITALANPNCLDEYASIGERLFVIPSEVKTERPGI